MHQQDDRLMRPGLMQLNERVRRYWWISEGGSYGMESTEPPFKKMRRSHDCSYSHKEQQRPRRPRRRVHFLDTPQVVVLPRRTSEDVSKCWHTRSDVAGFKRRTKL